MNLPPMCQPGALINKTDLFARLRDVWRERERAQGRKGSARSMADWLKETYPTVRVQRISQWTTGSDSKSLAPLHVIVYMCWQLGYDLVIVPEGCVLRKKA